MLSRRGPEAAELLGALPVALMVVDEDGHIAQANAECELLLNQSERAMRGRSVGDVLALPEEAVGQDGRAFTAFDLVLETARGQRLRVDLAAVELPDHPGWRMITLHNAASSRRLGVSADRAAAARSAVGAAAMLAHEIKNPLSSIRGAAQLIADGVDAAMRSVTIAATCATASSQSPSPLHDPARGR